jgi:hypothetical protein
MKVTSKETRRGNKAPLSTRFFLVPSLAYYTILTVEAVRYSETSLSLKRTSLGHIAEHTKYNDSRKVFGSSYVTRVSWDVFKRLVAGFPPR